MKYEVIRDCVIAGSRQKVGDIVDIEAGLANDLMGIGRVVPADESKIENRSIGLGEDKPRRRAKKAEPKVEVEPEVEAGEE